LDLPELSGKFTGQTLVAARYDIVTAADNRVSVVTNGGCRPAGLAGERANRKSRLLMIGEGGLRANPPLYGLTASRPLAAA
jgi:hypothetical protein